MLGNQRETVGQREKDVKENVGVRGNGRKK